MPIMRVGFGRPKCSDVEDRRKLGGEGALLAADNAAKPTPAICSLHRASAISDRNSHSPGDYARALSNGASRSYWRGGVAAYSHSKHQVPAASIGLPTETIATEPVHRLPQPPLLAIHREFVLRKVRAAIEQHAVPARHWLRLPAVASAPQAQLAAGACTIAARTIPRKP